MKRNIPLLLFFCIFLGLNAQAQTNAITGTVFDEIKEPVEMASIRILNTKDSSYVTGTVTNMDGKFNVGVKPGRYIAQISFIGYHDQFIKANAQKAVSVGDVYLKEDAIMLGEAVVEAKAIEIQVKGDTLEYNADSYKAQQSDVVEDMIKRMPGAEIDENGKITINGKEVKKFLVDGKEFFSDDPKVASKNLPASMVDKLQVLDRKSDMSQMTGFDDGEDETVINLTIKKGMKQGVFGNAFAGVGNKDRYEANGMVNYMRDNSQYTLLGGINNTNNAGFSDFASDMFSGRGGGRMRFGSNNGVAKTINGGFNFATEYSDKLKYGGNIRYGSVDNDVTTTSSKHYTGTDQSEATTSYGSNRSDNFGADFRFEWTPNDKTKIIFRPNIQYNKNRNDQTAESKTTFADNATENYTESSHNTSEGKGISLNGNLDISRKLNDAGRTLSFTFSGGLNNSDSEGYDYSHSTYSDPLKNDSIRDQKSLQDDKSYNWRAFVSYVEPLGRNNFLQLTYNIKNTHSETDRRTYDKDANGDYNVIAEAYTRNVKNDFLNQNVSLNFKSIREKFDYTLGVGLEPSRSKTSIDQPGEEEKDIKPRNFLSFAPNGQFNYRWDKRHNIRLDYSGRTTQPTTTQLYDGIISQNGFNVTYGNPDLKPSFAHRVRLRYQKFNSETTSNMMLFGNFNYTNNAIVNFTAYQGQSRETTYMNVNGNMDGNLRFIFNTPLKNKKFSFNTMTMGGYERDNTYIKSNDIATKNKADIYSLRENIGLQFRTGALGDQIKTLKDTKVLFNVSGNFSYNNIKNTISTESDQEVFTYGGKGDFSFYLPYGLTLQSDVQYSTNSGYSSGYKLDEWLWNASLTYDMDSMLKGIFKNKYTGNTSVRFKIYDILQERSNISNQQTAQYIQESYSNTINSYFMVHLIYKFQIFGKGTKREDIDMDSGRGWGGRGPGGPPPGGGPGGPM
jgi:hypothetical protein